MDYDEDMLQLWEEIRFSPIHPSMMKEYVTPGQDILTGLPLAKQPPERQATSQPQTNQKREPLMLKTFNWQPNHPSSPLATAPQPPNTQKKAPLVINTKDCNIKCPSLPLTTSSNPPKPRTKNDNDS